MKRKLLGGLLMTSMGLMLVMSLIVAAPVRSAQDESTPTLGVDEAQSAATPTVPDLQAGSAGASAPDALVTRRVRFPLFYKAPKPSPTPTPVVIKTGASAIQNCSRLSMLGLKRAAYYNWQAVVPECAGNIAVPMIKGPDLRPATITNSDYLLLFNECDLASQCGATPEKMAQEWHYWEQRFPTRKLIGPNITHSGYDWLRRWHEAYVRLYGKNPRIYALGFHCYGAYDWCQPRISEAIEIAKTWTTSGKVWLTEWGIEACPNGSAYSINEGQKLRAWMDANPGVETYMWFTTEFYWPEDPPGGFGRACNMPLIRDGILTEWGLWYKP